jgi:hypothetical protein
VAKERHPPTIADYVVTALSPALIMGLVGSLAFFLLEIMYAGQWPERLRWTLFFFVFGAVLVSRIAIQLDASKAWAYGAALGGVTLLAMGRFTDAGLLVNIIVVVVVLWSANKLTWDCTFVDEAADDGGGGILEEIRDELKSDPASRDRQGAVENPPLPDGRGSSSEARKARPMGRWVVYFSLAALPLFGLGQALIPAADEGRRSHAFWLMTLYVASGLGLLLTTTLLRLRRYLRQRRLQMPAAMTGLWIGVGAALIVGFLFIAALLPLSHPEYSLVPIRPFGSPERDASRYAMRSGNAGQGEGRGGGNDKTQNAYDGGGGKGQEGGKESGQSGKPEGQGGDKSGGKGKSDSQSKVGAESGDQQRSGEKTDGSDTSRSPSASGFAAVANILKWFALTILAIVLLLVVLWFVARHFASASDWARRLFEGLSALWRSLFGGSAPDSEAIEDVVVVQERPRPFADFSNPFTDGTAASRLSDDLVRYSFAALEAWAFERDLPRRPDETPLEFAGRIGEEVPDLAEDAQRLTVLYAGLAYGRRRLTDASRGHVQAFWRRLELTSHKTQAAPP